MVATRWHAGVFLHRFYTRRSFKTYNRYETAAACVLLASKVTDAPKKLQTVTRLYCMLRNPKQQLRTEDEVWRLPQTASRPATNHSDPLALLLSVLLLCSSS